MSISKWENQTALYTHECRRAKLKVPGAAYIIDDPNKGPGDLLEFMIDSYLDCCERFETYIKNQQPIIQVMRDRDEDPDTSYMDQEGDENHE